jgi:tetratricopeptide (TPR) repeat protein
MASNGAAADAERLAGNALFVQGLWEDAISHYRCVLAVNHSRHRLVCDVDASLPANFGSCSKAIALDARATAAYNNRAAAYINLKNFDAALEDCDRVLELEPDNTKALIRRAIAQVTGTLRPLVLHIRATLRPCARALTRSWLCRLQNACPAILLCRRCTPVAQVHKSQPPGAHARRKCPS